MSAGLREQKRLLARKAMENAAVEIAYTEGVAAVTVERVCAAAQVSRSTFFNYFQTLNHAIFGTALDYSEKLILETLKQHHGELTIAASLIVMRSVRGDLEDETTRKRYALFIREPGLTSFVSWSSHASRERLVLIIKKWLDDHPEDARLPHLDNAAEARLTVSLSIILGDEVQRLAVENDGEYLISAADFREIHDRIVSVALPLDSSPS